MMLLGLGLSFTLPYPAPLSEPPAPVSLLTPPRFRERIEQIRFSLGAEGIIGILEIDTLQRGPQEPFDFFGYKPVRIYVEGRDLCADFSVWGGAKQAPIEIRHNEFVVRPRGWDRNSGPMHSKW
jgi:hypothetical protein